MSQSTSWQLTWVNEIQQRPNWRDTVPEPDRRAVIEASIQENEAHAKSWEHTLAKIKPHYASSYATRGSTYPVNGRCICFTDGDDLYDAQYVCIDLFSGVPYYSKEVTLSGPGGSLITSFDQYALGWPQFLDIARSVSEQVYAHYRGIDDGNWKRYLSGKMVRFRIR